LSFAQSPIGTFLEKLASREPTPGGGSVAALTGALAGALGQMVAGYTLGKAKFADVEPEVRQIAGRLAEAQAALTGLMDEDAAAYGVLNAAFKIDKADPQRAERIQAAARAAGQVPLETATLAAQICADAERLLEIGNPMLRADAEAARHLSHAALHAAAANVRANLPLMAATAAEEIAGCLGALTA
jgi:formiminotetrahydrofolate cyclodeaminase